MIASDSFPIICASVYSQRQHDLLLDAYIRPFWEASHLKEAGGFFWTMRYGARGEHLKIRLHGPLQHEVETRQSLSMALDKFIDALPQKQYPDHPRSLPPIDPEDEAGSNLENTWQWTTFRPSPFVLGAERLARDYTLIELFARSQAAIAEVVMSDLVAQRLDASYATFRQSLFIRLLIASLGRLGFPATEREAYLRHHRDWLVRFFIAKEKSPDSTPSSILAPFRDRIERMAPTLESIRQRLETATYSTESHPIFAVWQQHLERFFAYTATFRGDPAYNLDPYTKDHSFLPLFKLLSGACNQFGLRLREELYIYHLLLTASTNTNC